MTPTDFLKSLVQDTSDRHKVVALTDNEVDAFLRRTPSQKNSSPMLFRDLQSNGLVSFTEYLFLIQILSKPVSGFEIAFKMLDTNLNGSVDAKEFVTLNKVISRVHNSRGIASTAPSDLIVPKEHRFQTTLVTHLFGRSADSSLSFDRFSRFVQNIQRESLEVEFRNRSFGADHISPVGFAKVLLQHSGISPSQYEEYLKRLNERVSESLSIKLDDYLKFFHFLNSLDDFALAVRMYTIANRPLALPDFARAVKACTGEELNSAVLHTIYALFDIDGDGCLSYQEFLYIMRGRRSRGAQANPDDGPIKVLRACVSSKLRDAAV